MHRLLCTALFASLTAVATPHARAGNLLDLTVVDRDTGATLPTYTDRGQLYVAGTPGHRYSVRLSNRSGGRVLAVLSVDGVNAISGQTADTGQTGYVLDAWESAEIAGWRKNLDEIAQFNFTALPDSYAARTGRPQNVGVIGVAVFAERAPIRREPTIGEAAKGAAAPMPATPPAAAEMQGAQRAAPSASMVQAQPESRAKADVYTPNERLGTGHGAREYAHVDTTAFERASRQPAEIDTIRYDSYANLVAQGIVRRPIAHQAPTPFPAGFVPDPMPH